MAKGPQRRGLKCPNPKCRAEGEAELTGSIRRGRFLKQRRIQVRLYCKKCNRKWWTRNRFALRVAGGLVETFKHLIATA